MTIAPGTSALMRLQFMMHAGMEGPHDFRIRIESNDPIEQSKEIIILSDWGP